MDYLTFSSPSPSRWLLAVTSFGGIINRLVLWTPALTESGGRQANVQKVPSSRWGRIQCKAAKSSQYVLQHIYIHGLPFAISYP